MAMGSLNIESLEIHLANTAILIDASQEIEAQCSVICVIKISPEDLRKYGDMPIFSHLEHGVLHPRVISS